MTDTTAPSPPHAPRRRISRRQTWRSIQRVAAVHLTLANIVSAVIGVEVVVAVLGGSAFPEYLGKVDHRVAWIWLGAVSPVSALIIATGIRGRTRLWSTARRVAWVVFALTLVVPGRVAADVVRELTKW